MTMRTVLRLSKCVNLYTAVVGLLIVGTESPMKRVQCYIIQMSICTIYTLLEDVTVDSVRLHYPKDVIQFQHYHSNF